MNSLKPNKPRVAVSDSAGVRVTHHANLRPLPVPASSNHNGKPSSPSTNQDAPRAPSSASAPSGKGTPNPPASAPPTAPAPNQNRASPNRIDRSGENLAPARFRKTGRKRATTRQRKTAHLVNQSVRRSDDEKKGNDDANEEMGGGSGDDGSDDDGPSSSGRLPYAPPEPKKLNGSGDYCDIDGIVEQPIFVPPTLSMVGLGYATLAAPFVAALAIFWAYPVISALVLQLMAVVQAYLLFRTDLTALLKTTIRLSVPNQTPPASTAAFLRESYTNPQRSLRLFHCTAVPFIQSLRLVFAPCTHAISGLFCKVGESTVDVITADERLPSVQAVEASNVLARIDLWNCISPSTMLYTTILSSQTVVQQVLSRVRALSTDDRDKMAESISARVVNVHIRASLMPDVQRGSAKLAAARATASDASDATIQTAHQIFRSRVSYFLLGALTSIVVYVMKGSQGSVAGVFLLHVCIAAPIYEELLKTALAALLGTTRYIPSLFFGAFEYTLYVCCCWASPTQRILPLLMHIYVGTQDTTRAIANHAAYNIGCCMPLIILFLLGPQTQTIIPAQQQLPAPVLVPTHPVDDAPYVRDLCFQFTKECLVPPFTYCIMFTDRLQSDHFDYLDCPSYQQYIAMCRRSDFCEQLTTTYPTSEALPTQFVELGRRRLGPLFKTSMCYHHARLQILTHNKLIGSSIVATVVFAIAFATVASRKQKKRLARGIRFACGYRVNEVNLPPPGEHGARISLTRKFFEACPTRSDSCSLGFTFSKFVPAFPDFCHPATALNGVLKRFCKNPPKPNARKLRSLRRFAERFVRKHYSPLAPDIDSSVETWLAATDYPDWRKKQLLECWWDKPWVVRDDFENKSFIKREFYTDFKAARGINSRSDTFKCFSGPYFKLIETQVYSQPCFDGTRLVPGLHNPFIKHIPCHLRPQFLTEMFEGCDGPFYETDYSQFEKHFTPEVMDALELVLYKHMLQHHPQVYSTIVAALRGTNKCCYNAFVIRIAARRMSGDMCTSLGNGFSNLILFNFVAYSKGGSAFGVVEGDDALFKSTVVLTMEDFRSLGFDIKIMSHSFLHLTSFCGMSFSSDGILLKDPLRVMPKFGWSFSPRRLGSDGTRLSLLKARALSLAYESPRCPIIHALAKRSLEVTEGSRPIFESGYHHAEVKSWIERFPDVMQHQLKNPPSLQSRIEFAAHFGISIALQLRVEEIIFAWDGSALNHPVIDLLFDHNSSLQAFSERYVDTNLDALIAQLEVNRQ